MTGTQVTGKGRGGSSPRTAPRSEPGPVARRERLAGRFLLAVGGGVAGLWVVSLPGAFRRGPFTYAGTPEAGNIPAFHLLAEAGMAATSLTAGTALLRGRPQGRAWALSACGMLIYSSVNSSGWLVRNQPAVTAVTGLTLAGTLGVVHALLRPEDEHPRVRQRTEVPRYPAFRPVR